MVCAFQANAQFLSEGRGKPRIVENLQVKFNLLSPGIDFEIGLFQNQTLVGGVGLGVGYYEEGYVFGLALNSEYRYYYNLKRRIRNDKTIGGNSGNYFGATRKIFFDPLIIATDIPSNDFNVGYYGLIHGVQRTTENGFHFDISGGVGYYLGDGVKSGYGPILSVKLGWVATKRKKKAIYFKD